jgi:hypothetical protein
LSDPVGRDVVGWDFFFFMFRDFVEISEFFFCNFFFFQWLHENGCTLQAECYAKAGFHGHMHVIEWLYKQHCLMDSQLLEDSARAGNLEIFQVFDS